MSKVFPTCPKQQIIMAWTEMMTPFPRRGTTLFHFLGIHEDIRESGHVLWSWELGHALWSWCGSIALFQQLKKKSSKNLPIPLCPRSQTCQIKIQDLFHGIFEWKLIGKYLDASYATKGQTSTENQIKSTSTLDSQLVEGTMGSGTKELYRSLTDATEDSEFAVRPGIATRGVFRFSAP